MRPTYLDNSRARAYCACSRCDGVVYTFFSRLPFLSSFSFSQENDPKKTDISSQRAVNQKQQPTKKARIGPISVNISRLFALNRR